MYCRFVGESRNHTHIRFSRGHRTVHVTVIVSKERISVPVPVGITCTLRYQFSVMNLYPSLRGLPAEIEGEGINSWGYVDQGTPKGSPKNVVLPLEIDILGL